MSLTNPEKVVTEERLSDFYHAILPYLGGMPDLMANKFSRANLYSSNEKIVGQWIDGKPLYQQTIEVATTTQSAKTDKTYNLTTDATFELRYGNGIIIHATGNVEHIPDGYIASSDGVVRRAYYIVQTSDTKYIQFLVKAFGAQSNTATAYITIQYTKTTDSATDIGIDTDYSTTEKIIGTWVDGSPLYQKTIYIPSLPNGTVGNYPHGITNLGDVADVKCVYKIMSGTYANTQAPIPFAHTQQVASSIAISITPDNIQINTGTADRRTLSAYCTIQYAKTS